MPAFGFNPYEEQTASLQSLGKSLFPDPSKAALAYHYGAESRKALMSSNKDEQALAAGATANQMLQGYQPNPTYRPGALDVPILAHPGNRPSLAQTAVPGPPAAGGMQPGPGGPVPSHWVPQTMAPEQVAQTVYNMAQSPSTSQAPAPYGPPSAVSPAAPQNTGTAGGGVPDVNTAGPFRADSFVQPNGGVKMAGPAAADGTPAPVGFNPAQFMNYLVQSGVPADQAQIQVRSVLMSWAKNNQMPLPQLEELAAFMGVPDMRKQVLADQGALVRTNAEQAGALARQKQADAGALARTLAPTTFIPDPDPARAAQGAGSFVPLGQQQGPGGMRGTNPAAVTELVKPLTVQPEPGGRPFSMTTGAAQAGQVPTYDSQLANTVAQAANQGVDFISPDDPLKMIRMTEARGQALGLRRAPTGADQVGAITQQAIQTAPTQETAEQIAKRREVAIPPPKTPLAEKAKEDEAQQALLDQTLQRRIARAPAGSWPWSSDDPPATPSGDLSAVLGKLTNDYYNSGPKGIKGEHIAAANAAIQQGIDEGWINPGQPKGTEIAKDVKEGNNIVTRPHTQIDLWDKAGNKPRSAAGFYPAMRGALAATAVPAATPAPAATPPASGTVLGPAPAGTPDGKTGTDTQTGAKVVVRGGNFVVQ